MKNFKKIIIICLFMLMSGCYKQDTVITINADKSIDLNIKILSKRALDDNIYFENKDIYDERGLIIEKIQDKEFNGYQITKKYDNIDELSIKTDVEINLNEYLNKEFNDKNLFKVEEGFLKNKYIANFKYKYIENDEIIEIETVESFLQKVEKIYTKALEGYIVSNKVFNLNSDNSNLEFESYISYNAIVDEEGKVTMIEVADGFYSYLKNDLDIKLEDISADDVKSVEKESTSISFTINLPSSAIENNADEVSANNKKLIWKYIDNEEKNIKFTFEIANKSNYYILFGILLISIILLVLLVLLVIKIKNVKKSRIESSTPIHADYDPSIKEIALNDKSKVISIDENEELNKVDNEEQLPSKEIENELIDIINNIEQKEEIIEIKDEK